MGTCGWMFGFWCKHRDGDWGSLGTEMVGEMVPEKGWVDCV